MEKNNNGERLEDGDTCLVCGYPVIIGISGNSVDGVSEITECNC